MGRLRNNLDGKWNDIDMLPCPQQVRKRPSGWSWDIGEGCSYTWAYTRARAKWSARCFWEEAILGKPPSMAGACFLLADAMEAGLLEAGLLKAEGLQEGNRGGDTRRQPCGSSGLFESSSS